MSDDSSDQLDRRTVLQGIAGAVATTGAAGVATADDSFDPAEITVGETYDTTETPSPDRVVSDLDPDSSKCLCWMETKCLLNFGCLNAEEDKPFGAYYKRECCYCDGDTVCEDWEVVDECGCDPYA